MSRVTGSAPTGRSPDRSYLDDPNDGSSVPGPHDLLPPGAGGHRQLWWVLAGLFARVYPFDQLGSFLARACARP